MHPPSFVTFYESEKSVRERRGTCKLTHTHANSQARAPARAAQETRYIKYILNLYSKRERLAAQPTLPSRRNTKFPYSDAPRQKLTLLRFIDPQYCVPPRGAPAVLVLRPRARTCTWVRALACTRIYTTSTSRTFPPRHRISVPGGAGIRFNGV